MTGINIFSNLERWRERGPSRLIVLSPGLPFESNGIFATYSPFRRHLTNNLLWLPAREYLGDYFQMIKLLSNQVSRPSELGLASNHSSVINTRLPSTHLA